VKPARRCEIFGGSKRTGLTHGIGIADPLESAIDGCLYLRVDVDHSPNRMAVFRFFSSGRLVRGL